MSNREYALIVAGGRGTRIQSSTPKQFIELAGKPILVHTIEAFIRYSPDIPIILVLPADDFLTWERIAKRFPLLKNIELQQGGATRFASVKRGLEKIEGAGMVAIHDGVRPLVSTAIIRESFEVASKHGSAVASVSLKESIREGTLISSRSLDRSGFRLIQTPQTFDVSLIRKAYELPDDPSLTDDASVAERAGHSVTLFEGAYSNIKVTTPDDLVIAEALINATL